MKVWTEFLGKCMSQAILLDAVTELRLYGTMMNRSLQWPLDYINLARLRRLSIGGWCTRKEAQG